MVVLLTGLAGAARNLAQERTRKSVEHRRRTGGKLGGRPPLTGGRQELVQRLRQEGRSFREVAQISGVLLATARSQAMVEAAHLSYNPKCTDSLILSQTPAKPASMHESEAKVPNTYQLKNAALAVAGQSKSAPTLLV